MTVNTETVKDWKGQRDSQPVRLRKLAARFRNGEQLHETELVILRDYAAANGLAVLHERIKQELRTQ
jgi:hypothetical protein